MKTVSIILLTLFLGKGCSSEQKKDLSTAVIEYSANTRGFYFQIIIQNQTVKISKDRKGADNPNPVKISDADWKELVADFQGVNLDGIADLKSPTQKRFYDGAAIANIKITYKGKTYESQAFDHGTPPAEIAKLVDKVTSFKKE